MQAGDLIFFSGKSFISRIVEIFTLSKFSHVGIVIDKNNLLEALQEGVVITPMSEAVKRKDKIFYCPLSGSARYFFNQDAFNKFVKGVIGKPYDYYQAGKSALDYIRKTKEDDNKYFCSELACDILKHSGVIKGINESTLSPIDLYRLLKKEDII